MLRCPILMYHWFRAEGVPDSVHSPQLSISPGLFDRQLGLLRRAGYESISLGRALGGERLPRRPIVITFDDGTADFWDHARPALERHGFRATLFVVTGHVGALGTWDGPLGEPDRPLLDWDQLRRLERGGFEIGSHTHTHRPLTDLSDDEARRELVDSRRKLAAELGEATRFVAYPRGFYAARHKRLARDAGYEGACAVILNWADLRFSDRYELKRMTVKGSESMLRFRLRLWLARRVSHARG